MKKPKVKHAILLLIFGTLVGLYQSDAFLFERPERDVQRYHRNVGAALRENHGLVLLLDFHTGKLIERMKDVQINKSGVKLVREDNHYALAFDGHQRTFVESNVEWLSLGEHFTISTWVKLNPSSQRQDIANALALRGAVGLRLTDGKIVFDIPPWNQNISYAFNDFDRFVHLLAVADGDSGKARLYQNGALMATGDIDSVEPPNHNIEFGKTRWYVLRNPFQGLLGETAVWQRALSPEEVQKVYQANGRLVRKYEPRHFAKLTVAEWRADFQKSLSKTIDYFNPIRRPGLAQHADLPEVNLLVSNADRRHFLTGHRESIQSGRRRRDAARKRDISVGMDGTHLKAQLQLYGNNMSYTAGERMAFMLEVDQIIPGFETDRLLLAPPESKGFLQRIGETKLAQFLALPHVKNGLCRLYINGTFQGIYYFEDHAYAGMFPGAGEHLFYGPMHPHDWRSRFPPPRDTRFQHTPLAERIPMDTSTIQAIIDKAYETYFPILTNDARSPMSAREIRYHLQNAHDDMLASWQDLIGEDNATDHAAKALNPYMFLGQNVSPFYITTDLHLKYHGFPDIQIEWTSANTNRITHDGKVLRPHQGPPEEVTLEARITDQAKRTNTVSMQFRVMPQTPSTPALMLYINEQLNKLSRADVIIHKHNGSHVPVKSWMGTQDTRAGLGHRGGSGYWEPKKPFSLRFNEPHMWLNDTPTRHLYLGTGYDDPSYMRNRLSYKLFRKSSTEGEKRYAPHVIWVEVFVNGRYQGIYEAGTRVMRRMLGWPSFNPQSDQPHGHLYKVLHARQALDNHEPGSVTQKYPQTRFGDHMESFVTFIDLLNASPEKIAAEAPERMDVSNFIDFHLWMNLTEARDSVNVNFYFAQEPGENGRYFIIPFDADKNFQLGGTRSFNNLFVAPFLQSYPEFEHKAAKRWTELRNEVLQPDIWIERLQSWTKELDQIAHWDHEKWPPRHKRYGFDDPQTFLSYATTLQTNFLRRITYMDERYVEP